MSSYLDLSYAQIALAALLIVINGVISVALRLGMEKSLLLASVRTVGQLLLIGIVLQWIFRFDHWYVVVGWLVVMTLVAGITAGQRSRRRFPGLWITMIVSIWASSWIVTAFALFVVFHGIEKWYQPQYAIPLMGMVLGNTLNGVTIGLNTFSESLVTRRDHVESALAMGATRWEAALPSVQHAIRTGMTPIINAMMIVGVVSLPGMMTGQLLSGTSPMQAVKYQIVIMFLIAAATALGTVAAVVLTFLRLFNGRHQFLHERLSEEK